MNKRERVVIRMVLDSAPDIVIYRAKRPEKWGQERLRNEVNVCERGRNDTSEHLTSLKVIKEENRFIGGILYE